MPERVVCSIASGVWQECREIDEDLPLRSSKLLKSMDRASTTKHESQSRQAYEQEGLRVKVPQSFINIGLKRQLPWLKASDMIRTMALHNKLDDCLFGGLGLDGLRVFWDRYRRIWPNHPIYTDRKSDLERCIPVYIHADEGRYLKREQILIINFQSVLGKGTSMSTAKDLSKYQGLNFLGSCYSTRFLLATLLCLHYRKKNKDGHRLQSLLKAITDDFLTLYMHGVQMCFKGEWITLFAVPLGLKGDWPMLSKLGNLTQSFTRRGRPSPSSCICHLCSAGAAGFPYHEHEINASWYSTYLKTRPWRTPSTFMRLPTLPAAPELFYCFDIFHVCHKGIYAELAGSGLVA